MKIRLFFLATSTFALKCAIEAKKDYIVSGIECSETNLCKDGACCNKFGFCGYGYSFCSPKEHCKSNCWDHNYLPEDYYGDQVLGRSSCIRKNVVALTFSSGPSVYFAKILDELKNENLKATFFIIGRKIAGNEELIKRAYDEGHTIGSQGWSYTPFSTMSESQLIKELHNTSKALERITGEHPVFVQPPKGDIKECNKDVLESLGYKVVLWNMDSLDWQVDFLGKHSDDMYRVFEGYKTQFEHREEGWIAQMHDNFSCTHKSLPKNVSFLRKYLTFVDMFECFDETHKPTQTSIDVVEPTTTELHEETGEDPDYEWWLDLVSEVEESASEDGSEETEKTEDSGNENETNANSISATLNATNSENSENSNSGSIEDSQTVSNGQSNSELSEESETLS